MDLFGSVVGSVLVAAVGGLINAIFQKDTNDDNKQFVEQQNNITREREDTAIQRKISDAKAAGISPLSVLGSGGASTSTPLSYTAQAPQFDVSQIVGSLINSSQISQSSYEKQQDVAMKDKDLAYQEKVLMLKKAELGQQFTLENMKINQALEMHKDTMDLEDRKLLESVRQFNESMKEQQYQFDKESALNIQEQQLQEYRHFCDMLQVPVKIEYVSDYSKYQEKMTLFQSSWAGVLNTVDFDNLTESSSDSTSTSKGNSLGGSAGASMSEAMPGMMSNTGALNFGVNGSKSDSESKSHSEVNSRRPLYNMAESFRNMSYPVLIYDSKRKN